MTFVLVCFELRTWCVYTQITYVRSLALCILYSRKYGRCLYLVDHGSGITEIFDFGLQVPGKFDHFILALNA